MRIQLIILTAILVFYGARPALASAPVLSNVPAMVNIDSEFSATVSMNGLSNNAVYRLRLAMSVPGTSNYFGSTFNGNGWYNGTPSPINYANFLSITTDSSGSWSGTVRGKIESSDRNFSTGTGVYDLKVGRYTENGNSATWSNIVQISIVSPSPSPSASNTPAPSLTPPPTPTPTATISPSPSTQTPSFTISEVPAEINQDQSFMVKVALVTPNNPDKEYYLKGAFKKTDGTRYFGLTKKDAKWIGYGDDYTNQNKITTNSQGYWNGSLEIKPDTSDSDYKGSGNYIFKVGKFTANSSPAWSNEVTIKISDVTTLPSLAPSQNPSPSPSPTPTEKNQLQVPAYKTPTIKIKIASVAGVTDATTPLAVKVKNTNQLSPLIWIGLFLLFAGTGYLGYIYRKEKWKN